MSSSRHDKVTTEYLEYIMFMDFINLLLTKMNNVAVISLPLKEAFWDEYTIHFIQGQHLPMFAS